MRLWIEVIKILASFFQKQTLYNFGQLYYWVTIAVGISLLYYTEWISLLSYKINYLLRGFLRSSHSFSTKSATNVFNRMLQNLKDHPNKCSIAQIKKVAKPEAWPYFSVHVEIFRWIHLASNNIPLNFPSNFSISNFLNLLFTHIRHISCVPSKKSLKYHVFHIIISSG